MNANPNITSYRMHELTRDAAMRTAARQRLAHEAAGASPVRVHELLARRSLRIAAALVAFVLLMLAAQSASAQALHDDGGGEPYHPALVSFRLGIYYQLKGDHERAVAEFSGTIAAFPMVAEAWAARADSFLALEAFEEALADYDEAIALAPDLVSAVTMRGHTYRQMGETEAALADYSNAIGQMPAYPEPHAGLAAAYELQGRLGDALAEYETYLTLAGPEADPLVSARATELRQTVAAGAA